MSTRTCPICTEKLAKGDAHVLYGCVESGVRGHLFHLPCIEYWFRTSRARACPLCRRSSALIFCEKDAPETLPLTRFPMRAAIRYSVPDGDQNADDLHSQLAEVQDETYFVSSSNSSISSEVVSESRSADSSFRGSSSGSAESNYSESSGSGSGSELIAFSERRGEKRRYSERNYARYHTLKRTYDESYFGE